MGVFLGLCVSFGPIVPCPVVFSLFGAESARLENEGYAMSPLASPFCVR